jgi:hypothetical protein
MIEMIEMIGMIGMILGMDKWWNRRDHEILHERILQILGHTQAAGAAKALARPAPLWMLTESEVV